VLLSDELIFHHSSRENLEAKAHFEPDILKMGISSLSGIRTQVSNNKLVGGWLLGSGHPFEHRP